MADSVPTPDVEEETTRPHVIGVGASAGGLEALTQLVTGFPRDINASIVIIQHLSPNYRSMMAELLGRETALKVSEAENDKAPKSGHIYIAPPKWDLIIKEGVFKLLEPVDAIAPKPSVNRFFSSLSEDLEENAMAVILSGTGTDGAAGTRAIKANGGITFAQDPSSAKYAGMPQAAINTGTIDHVLEPRNIAEEISSLVALVPESIRETPNETEAEQYKRLFQMVRRQTRIDFSGYKPTTLWRRIHRRMATNRIVQFNEYLEYVSKTPNELESLSKDILISVTAFFRDSEVFAVLQRELADTLARKQPGDDIRIWVPGCATGEEAYSIGILLHEILGQRINEYEIQIFATDIDLKALDIARSGTYESTALEAVDRSIIDKYFIHHGNDFEISKRIRDLVVFARQDIVLDPPFLRLDLVSCRNLLIYFDNDLQQKVLRVINYSLLNKGLLMLGKSESVSQQPTLFETLHPRAKLFRSLRNTEYRTEDNSVMRRPRQTGIEQPQIEVPNHETIFNDLISQAFTPPCVLLDDHFKTLMVRGDVSDYLSLPPGRTGLDITRLLNTEMSAELVSMLHNARRKKKTFKGRRRRLKPGPEGLVQMIVTPSLDEHANQLYLLAFQKITPVRQNRGEISNLSPKAMEDELATTREHLQTVTEELETSNEELQALNEEVQASNEELQASNEELEASNEELQATNEELVTVNEEMLVKSAELAAINSDFAAVNNSMDFPVIVLNPELQVARVNKAAKEIYGSTLPGVGALLKQLDFDDGAISSETIDVVRQSGRREVLQQRIRNRECSVHITPCFDQLDRNRGVIITLVDQHDLLKSEHEATRANNFLMAMMDNSVSLVTVKDPTGRYQFANQSFLNKFGLEDVEGKTDASLFPDRISKMMRQNDLKLFTDLEPFKCEERFIFNDEEVLFESIRFPLLDADNVAYAVCTQSIDLSLEKQSRDQLRLAAMVFDRAAEGIMVTDADQNIVSVNDAFTQVTGYTREEAIGEKPGLLSSGKHNKAYYADMWDRIKNKGWWQGEIWNRTKDGNTYPEWLTVSEVRDSSDNLVNYLGIFSDITKIKDSQVKAEYLATHDELTGLPNRTLLNDRLKHALSRARRNDSRLFIMFCDLDNFKVINDTLGHETGDDVLKEAAQRLEDSIREQDTVSRIGGDEFVIMIEDAEISDAEMVARRVLDNLSMSFHYHDTDLFISASIGISQFPEDGDDGESLMKYADAAMYRSKDQGKNQYNYFAEDMRVAFQKRLAIETGLRMALRRNDFHMAYQPVIDSRDGSIHSVEALLRWEIKEFPNITPDEFIPIAEESMLISQIDQWVLKQVIHDVQQWHHQGYDVPQVSINLSGHQFNQHTIGKVVEDLLRESGLDGERFVLEITENALVESLGRANATIEHLRGLGIRFAIDDFGTGYSSLSYLQKLPIDILKIDKDFIDGLNQNKDDSEITTAIISMGKALGLSIIAEGVETPEQVDTLADQGCHHCQGFHYHYPMPADQLLSLFESNEGEIQ